MECLFGPGLSVLADLEQRGRPRGTYSSHGNHMSAPGKVLFPVSRQMVSTPEQTSLVTNVFADCRSIVHHNLA